MRTVRNLILIFSLLLPTVKGVRLKGQAVTFADFNYINYVASSISHVYFATTDGITRYNKQEKHWDLPLTGAEGMIGEEVKRLWVDTFDDHLYAKTNINLYEYNITFDSWMPITELPDFNNDTRHMSRTENLLPPFGFNYLTDGRMVDTYTRSFETTDILNDQTGELWIGTWGYGAAKANDVTRLIELLPFGLIQNNVTSIYADDSIMWLGGNTATSYRTGLTVFNPKKLKFDYIESGLNQDFPAADVHCIEGDEANIYVGTEQGLYIIDKETHQVHDHYNRRWGLSDDRILSILSRGNILYVGTAAGLNLINLKNRKAELVRPRQFVNTIIYDLEEIDNYLWIGTNFGTYRMNLDNNNLQKFQDPKLLVSGHVFTIKKFQHEIWFATDNGVVLLNKNTGEMTPFNFLSNRLDSRAMDVNAYVTALATDRGMTIIFFDRDEPYSREFTVSDGLASDYVYALHFDGDYIWIGTDKGLTRFLWNNPNRID